MKKFLDASCLDDLARGATFLGSGGGGNPISNCLLTESLLQGETLAVKPLAECGDEEMVVLIAGVGAPLVSSERLRTARQYVRAIECMEQTLGRRIDNVATGEIGGGNAFAGLIAALAAKKHLIDADSLGRAFPTMNICSCALEGLCPTPAVMVDALGNAVVFHTTSPDVFERHARAIVTAMGSSGVCAFYPMTGRQAKKALIGGTLSEAVNIGRKLRTKRELPCAWVGRGVISRIEQEIDKGFLLGKVIIDGGWEIEFQNEFLVVYGKDHTPIHTTPDIITLLESETLDPVGTDQIRYGLEVDIVVAASPSIWRTKQGLALTAPAAFGYSFGPMLIQEDV